MLIKRVMSKQYANLRNQMASNRMKEMGRDIKIASQVCNGLVLSQHDMPVLEIEVGRHIELLPDQLHSFKMDVKRLVSPLKFNMHIEKFEGPVNNDIEVYLSTVAKAPSPQNTYEVKFLGKDHFKLHSCSIGKTNDNN